MGVMKCPAVKRPAAALSRAGSMKKPRVRVRPASHSGKSNGGRVSYRAALVSRLAAAESRAKEEELRAEAATQLAADAQRRAEAAESRADAAEASARAAARRRALIEDSIEWAQTVRKYGGPEAEPALRKRVRTLAKA